ncbi:MAG: redoxin domain-containing protein [Planctomycetota bacterium]|jgi:peroxiredoxin
MKTLRMLACVSLCLLALSSPAWAQDGQRGHEGRMRGRQQLSPEQAKAAWKWEAQEVARTLELSGDQTAQLIKVYTANREQFSEALRKHREATGGERWARNRQFDPEVLVKQRAAFQTQLSGFLPEDQTKDVVKSLGLFSSQWDRMVNAVAGLELDEEKTYAVLGPIRRFMVQAAGAQRLEDRQAARGVTMEAREALYDSLTKVLGEEQLAQFQAARGGRQGQPRGGQRRGERAPEQVATAGIGEPAPAFALNDSEGKKHALADYRGKIVVLQWINPDCPVCLRTSSSGKVTAMRKQLDEISPGGVVHLTVNSTHYMEPAAGAAYLKKYKIDAPVLIDQDGTVGHLYDAKRTPHMYVIDAKGILRYQGAIDDDSSGAKGDQATNYVVQAVQQIVAGETVAPDVTHSYGCSVKYPPK